MRDSSSLLVGADLVSARVRFTRYLQTLCENLQVHQTKRRRSTLRLRGFDYSSEGAYFVTICAQDRLCLFGEVADDSVHLNEAGMMIDRWWREIGATADCSEFDEYVVMPNHLHGILWHQTEDGDSAVSPGATKLVDVSSVVQSFKTFTTNDYIRHVKNSSWPPFPGKLWQRGFYDHVIRDEEALQQIRQYIRDNPRRWAQDPENPGKDR